jgi:AcrR family transcriptional regulator
VRAVPDTHEEDAVPGYVRADVRREQLLAAAHAVLVRDGLDRLTLRSVAAEAGVHLGTLQYVFRSRADLVGALAERTLDRAGYGQFEIGPGGLRIELERLFDWIVVRFLADPAMLELLRHEYAVTVARVDPAASIELPLRQRIAPADYSGQLAEIARRSDEAYQRSYEDLGRLWGLGLTGLFHEFLATRDMPRFRDDAALLVAAVVAVAQPSPARPPGMHPSSRSSGGAE